MYNLNFIAQIFTLLCAISCLNATIYSNKSLTYHNKTLANNIYNYCDLDFQFSTINNSHINQGTIEGHFTLFQQTNIFQASYKGENSIFNDSAFTEATYDAHNVTSLYTNFENSYGRIFNVNFWQNWFKGGSLVISSGNLTHHTFGGIKVKLSDVKEYESSYQNSDVIYNEFNTHLTSKYKTSSFLEKTQYQNSSLSANNVTLKYPRVINSEALINDSTIISGDVIQSEVTIKRCEIGGFFDLSNVTIKDTRGSYSTFVKSHARLDNYQSDHDTFVNSVVSLEKSSLTVTNFVNGSISISETKFPNLVTFTHLKLIAEKSQFTIGTFIGSNVEIKDESLIKKSYFNDTFVYIKDSTLSTSVLQNTIICEENSIVANNIKRNATIYKYSDPKCKERSVELLEGLE